MECSSLLFLPPAPTYDRTTHRKFIFYIKKKFPDSHEQLTIPCFYVPSKKKPSNKVAIYFHCNAEDNGQCLPRVKLLRDKLGCHFLVPEYPGYGVYTGTASQDALFDDADRVLDYMTHELGCSIRDVLLVGRSIGTGPATHLASKCPEVGGLALVSPLTGTKQAAAFHAGSFGKLLIKQQFNNAEYMKTVRCPVFIYHGEEDKVLPCSMARELADACTAPHMLVTGKHDTHDKINLVLLTAKLHRFVEENCGWEAQPAGKCVGALPIPKSDLLETVRAAGAELEPAMWDTYFHC